MGVMFHWFHNAYRVEYSEHHVAGIYSWDEVQYIGGGRTSHSYGNRRKLQLLFEKTCGICIPTIDNGLSEKPIDPHKMIEYCDMVLEQRLCDVYGLRERVEWIRGLSTQGYYISYEIN